MKPTFLLLTTLLLSAGCSSIQHLDSTKHEVIPVPQGIQDPVQLQSMQQRISNGEPVIFKAAAGERMPFRLGLELPIGKLDKSESEFAFSRDTYFLFAKKQGIQLSPDGQRWAGVAHPKAMAKLFGFKHGEASFSFTTTTNKNPFMILDLKVR